MEPVVGGLQKEAEILSDCTECLFCSWFRLWYNKKKIKILTRSKMRSINPHAWYCIGPPDATKLALFCQKVETGIMTCLSSSSIVLSRLKYWINVAGRLQTLSQCTGLLRVSFWFAMGSSFSHLLFFFIFFPRFFYFLVNPIAAYLLHV